MKPFTQEEIKFLKDTGLTATVIQCNEWQRTTLKDAKDAKKTAKKYGINYANLKSNILNYNDSDSISLEIVGTYILGTLYSKEFLKTASDEQIVKALKDWRYFDGFRKEESAEPYRSNALDWIEGRLKMILMNGEIWF